MAEVFLEFDEPLKEEGGSGIYTARACGSQMPDGRWQGWIEFVPLGTGEPFRTSRETTQPNRSDLAYWATGLSHVYLEGALRRAQNPLVRPAPKAVAPPIFDEPAVSSDVDVMVEPVEAVLNPFSVLRKGEPLLRRQLAALSAWHLVNIVRAFGLSDMDSEQLNAMSAAELVELIVAAARRHESVRTE